MGKSYHTYRKDSSYITEYSAPQFGTPTKDINRHVVMDFFFKYFISIGIETPFISFHVSKAGTPINLHIKKISHQKIIKYESIGH